MAKTHGKLFAFLMLSGVGVIGSACAIDGYNTPLRAASSPTVLANTAASPPHSSIANAPVAVTATSPTLPVSWTIPIFGKTTGLPPGTPMLQFAGRESRAAAEAQYVDLLKKYGSLFEGRTYAILDPVPNARQIYRLQIQFPDQTTARAAAKRLRADKIDCFVPVQQSYKTPQKPGTN